MQGGAQGGKARLELDQMSRKALLCKACVEQSDYFRAARRHKNNDIISERTEGAAMRILVAEDQPELLRMLVKNLTAAGYNVDGVPDGAERSEERR